jgi:hypothetical protein
VVEIQDNYNQITKDSARLSKAGYFLKQFIGKAKMSEKIPDWLKQVSTGSKPL